MLEANQSFAYGFFKDEESAATAVQGLLDADFDSEHIGALMLDGSHVTELPIKHKTAIGKGVVIGTLLGAAVGAALPGLGLGLMAFGSGFAHLAGAAAGGATGTLAGVVGGLGIWKDEVDVPRHAFENGAVLVGVLVPPQHAERAHHVLAQSGATSTALSTRNQAKRELLEQSKHARMP